MSEQLLEKWIASIKDQFVNGSPNGKALGWDPHRFELQIRDFAKPFKYYNRTTFDYKYCNSYQVVVNRPDEDRWLLMVQISFVVDGYILWWTHYKPTGDTEVSQTHPDSAIQALPDNIRSYLNGQGFTEVPMDWYRSKLPNVKLQISAPQDVTLGKCLFEDHAG